MLAILDVWDSPFSMPFFSRAMCRRSAFSIDVRSRCSLCWSSEKVEVRSADLLSSLRLAHGYTIFVGRIEEGSSSSKCVGDADEWVQLMMNSRAIVRSLSKSMEPDVSNPSTLAAVVMDRQEPQRADMKFHKRTFRFLHEDEVE